ncbi:uncharacterized protein LOC116341338 [Contarinia nasturtii]|uniref:uncharacterized protein LOC116341338 n=1 Tax=Contarinia nasturtii TaxID=265458 RepID=UPI0012D37E0E|nr:uncharacterized protein LOC116341338 [Contarinia nasturtii]
MAFTSISNYDPAAKRQFMYLPLDIFRQSTNIASLVREKYKQDKRKNPPKFILTKECEKYHRLLNQLDDWDGTILTRLEYVWPHSEVKINAAIWSLSKQEQDKIHGFSTDRQKQFIYLPMHIFRDETNVQDLIIKSEQKPGIHISRSMLKQRIVQIHQNLADIQSWPDYLDNLKFRCDDIEDAVEDAIEATESSESSRRSSTTSTMSVDSIQANVSKFLRKRKGNAGQSENDSASEPIEVPAKKARGNLNRMNPINQNAVTSKQNTGQGIKKKPEQSNLDVNKRTEQHVQVMATTSHSQAHALEEPAVHNKEIQCMKNKQIRPKMVLKLDDISESNVEQEIPSDEGIDKQIEEMFATIETEDPEVDQAQKSVECDCERCKRDVLDFSTQTEEAAVQNKEVQCTENKKSQPIVLTLIDVTELNVFEVRCVSPEQELLCDDDIDRQMEEMFGTMQTEDPQVKEKGIDQAQKHVECHCKRDVLDFSTQTEAAVQNKMIQCTEINKSQPIVLTFSDITELNVFEFRCVSPEQDLPCDERIEEMVPRQMVVSTQTEDPQIEETVIDQAQKSVECHCKRNVFDFSTQTEEIAVQNKGIQCMEQDLPRDEQINEQIEEMVPRQMVASTQTEDPRVKDKAVQCTVSSVQESHSDRQTTVQTREQIQQRSANTIIRRRIYSYLSEINRIFPDQMTRRMELLNEIQRLLNQGTK